MVRIAVTDRYHIGQEFFRWEIATAVAGAILGINPFDQPDVEASKVKTRELTTAYEKSGALPPEAAFFEEDGISLFADQKNRSALGQARSLVGYLRAHLERLQAGDYCALLAYVERNKRHHDTLQDIRADGPRPQAGRDLPRLRAALPAFDRPGLQGRPEHRRLPADHLRRCATILRFRSRNTPSASSRRREARGDFEVLAERGRRVLRVHLGPTSRPG